MNEIHLLKWVITKCWNTSTEVGDHKMLKYIYWSGWSQNVEIHLLKWVITKCWNPKRLGSMCISFSLVFCRSAAINCLQQQWQEGLSLGMWHCAVGWAVPYTAKASQLHDIASNVRWLESSTPLWEMNKSEWYSNYVHTNTKCTFILFKPTHALFSEHINIHI